MIRRWFRDESGQDVIEYGLLAATIGLVGILAWQGVQQSVGNAYQSWDSGVQQKACNPNPVNAPQRPGICEPDPSGGIQ